MRAGKAYITSLGTTAMLVASSVLLLVVVGALIAFDGWPSSNAYSTPETVAIGKGDPERVVAKRRLARERRAAELRRDRARDRRARGNRSRSRSDGGARDAGDRVISDLPAPDSRPGLGGGRGATGAEPVAGAVPAVPGGGAGGDAVGQVGGTVGTVDPQAGTTIGETGDAISGAIDEAIVQAAPELVTGPRLAAP